MRPSIFGIERYPFVMYFLKYNYNMNAVSVKFPIDVFYEIDKLIIKFTENTRYRKFINKTINKNNRGKI